MFKFVRPNRFMSFLKLALSPNLSIDFLDQLLGQSLVRCFISSIPLPPSQQGLGLIFLRFGFACLLCGHHLRRADHVLMVPMEFQLVGFLSGCFLVEWANRLVRLHALVELLLTLLFEAGTHQNLGVDVKQGVNFSHVGVAHVLKCRTCNLLSHG